jgi:dTDP-4-dehydrorhamnose reductase
MKILITGASSLPGYRTLLEALKKENEIIALYYNNSIPIENKKLKKISIDITKLNDLRKLLFEERPEVVIHMAAIGDVDLCEKNKELAWKTTVNSSIEIASIALKLGFFVIYLSTDYIFDGEKGNYKENDIPNPINYYGITKLMGEIAFLSCSNCAIVRASSIYGFGPGRMNFAKYIYEKLKAREYVKALIDQYTSPTQASLLGKAIIEISEKKLEGIFHIVGERMSRYEFAIKIAETLGLDKSLIKKAEMKDMNWIAKRPKDSSLNYDETKKRIKTNFYSTKIALKTLTEDIS